MDPFLCYLCHPFCILWGWFGSCYFELTGNRLTILVLCTWWQIILGIHMHKLYRFFTQPMLGTGAWTLYFPIITYFLSVWDKIVSWSIPFIIPVSSPSKQLTSCWCDNGEICWWLCRYAFVLACWRRTSDPQGTGSLVIDINMVFSFSIFYTHTHTLVCIVCLLQLVQSSSYCYHHPQEMQWWIVAEIHFLSQHA